LSANRGIQSYRDKVRVDIGTNHINIVIAGIQGRGGNGGTVRGQSRIPYNPQHDVILGGRCMQNCVDVLEGFDPVSLGLRIVADVGRCMSNIHLPSEANVLLPESLSSVFCYDTRDHRVVLAGYKGL